MEVGLFHHVINRFLNQLFSFGYLLGSAPHPKIDSFWIVKPARTNEISWRWPYRKRCASFLNIISKTPGNRSDKSLWAPANWRLITGSRSNVWDCQRDIV